MHQGQNKVGKYRAQCAAGGVAFATSNTHTLLEKKGDSCYDNALALQLEHIWAPMQPTLNKQLLQQLVLTAPHSPVDSTYLR